MSDPAKKPETKNASWSVSDEPTSFSSVHFADPGLPNPHASEQSAADWLREVAQMPNLYESPVSGKSHSEEEVLACAIRIREEARKASWNETFVTEQIPVYEPQTRPKSRLPRLSRKKKSLEEKPVLSRKSRHETKEKDDRQAVKVRQDPDSDKPADYMESAAQIPEKTDIQPAIPAEILQDHGQSFSEIIHTDSSASASSEISSAADLLSEKAVQESGASSQTKELEPVSAQKAAAASFDPDKSAADRADQPVQNQDLPNPAVTAGGLHSTRQENRKKSEETAGPVQSINVSLLPRIRKVPCALLMVLLIGALLAFWFPDLKTSTIYSSASFDTVLAALQETCGEQAYPEAEAVTLKRAFGLEPDSFPHLTFLRSMDVMQAGELLLMQSDDPDQLEQFAQAARSRQDAQYEVYESYAPAQAALVSDALIDVEGNYALYYVGENPAQIQELFKELLKQEAV